MTHTPHVDISALRNALGRYGDRVSVAVWDEIDSTNNAAKSEADRDTPSLYVARAQTEGRGRLGRSFHSPADTGLYMTVAYTVKSPLSEAVRVTAAAAVAACSAIETLTGISPSIKWINDLYLNGAKVGGILTEAVTRPDGTHRMVVGLGINLTTSSFPEGLRAPATSLFSPHNAHTVTPVLMGSLVGEITRRLLDMTRPEGGGDFPAGMWGDACLGDYRRRLLYVDSRVICAQGDLCFEGTLLGVNNDFSLLVETQSETVTLFSGEISVRPLSYTYPPASPHRM
ncbi:MAG: biotin--[Clostridia bacterium]|nr:biotin--[acetyl-CoA-carboxylase] ligase [Clostridia bacterium]